MRIAAHIILSFFFCVIGFSIGWMEIHATQPDVALDVGFWGAMICSQLWLVTIPWPRAT